MSAGAGAAPLTRSERAARSVRDPLTVALLLLTFTTGIVDAVSFLGLGRVFSANMTGNIVFLGFGMAGSGGLPPVAPLVSLGAAVVLTVVVRVHANAVSGDAVIGLLACGMGLRNATVRRLSVPDMTTTVLTLTLTGLAADSQLFGGTGKGTTRRVSAVLAIWPGR